MSNNETIKPYPDLDLGRTYQYLLRVENIDADRQLKSKDLMHAIGYAKRSGRVSRILGALRQFGLASYDGMFYRITDLGKDLLSADMSTPSGKNVALRVATSPKLYGALYEITAGARNISLSNGVRGTLSTYGIEPGDRDTILKSYNDTLKFVDMGITFELPPRPTEAMAPEAKIVPNNDSIHVDFGNDLVLSIPKDLVLKVALEDLSKKGPSSKVRIISRNS